MTAKKKAATGKRLKVKKETLKDLDVKSRAEGVKAGKGTGAKTTDCLTAAVAYTDGCPPVGHRRTV